MSEALTKYEAQADIMQVWSNPQEIKSIFANNLTDSEFSYFMSLSKATGANPFLKEIWAVKYGNSPAQVFHGRDFYRRRAQELDAYEGHTKGAIYENDEFSVENGVPQHRYHLTNRGNLIAAYCVVYVKGRRVPFLEVVELKEYSTGKSLWGTKPATMLVKVAEAQALRGAFQGIFGGTYDESESWDERQKAPVGSPFDQKATPQLEKAYTVIEEKLEELDYHPKHLIASLSKHLEVDALRKCQDIDKLRKYYKHLDNKLIKDGRPVDIELTQEELTGMLETVEKWMPKMLDEFVEAADAKKYMICQDIFDSAIEERSGMDV
jgi:phage recombination protein Bet